MRRSGIDDYPFVQNSACGLVDNRLDELSTGPTRPWGHNTTEPPGEGRLWENRLLVQDRVNRTRQPHLCGYVAQLHDFIEPHSTAPNRT